jgi:crotonobetainyl-CoA:carnitine CoA-transferase CaiB-like acyl-CoA transferase
VVRFDAAAIASGPIYEFDEVFEDPQVRHLGVVTEMDQPGYGPVRMLSFPFKASATPAAIRRPAPLLGEHTAEVLEEFGRDAADIERLAARGVIALGTAAGRPK